jgi:hypothetical protein
MVTASARPATCLVALVLVGLTVGGCRAKAHAPRVSSPLPTASSAAPSPEPTGSLSTFIGIVRRLERLPGWTYAPHGYLSPGDGTSSFTMGPGVLVLTDGRRIHLASRTPGGNACFELLTRADWPAVTGFEHPTERMVRQALRSNGPCAVVGQLRKGNKAAWFSTRIFVERLNAVRVGAIESYSAAGPSVTVIGGARFTVSAAFALDCFGSHDIHGMLDHHVPHVAYVSATTSQLTAVECLGRA